MTMEGLDLPPWLQTTLTVLGILAVILPPFGRLLASKWPDVGARIEALGVDLRTALGKTPPAGMPRGVLPAAPLPSERAENATTVVRAELKKAAKGGSVPPPLVMMLLLLALAGCSRADVIAGANVHHDAGHATARILAEACDYEAAERLGGDLARERAAQLDAIHCEEAWLAQRAFAAAHRAQVRAIEAAEAGKCVIGAPRNEPACNLLQVAAATYQAGVALADAAAMVRAAARGAR
jgi:hypothetical protein